MIANGAGTLTQLAADGQMSEAIDLDAPCVATPLVHRGTAYLGSLDGRGSAIALAPDSRRNEACSA